MAWFHGNEEKDMEDRNNVNAVAEKMDDGKILMNSLIE